MVDEAGVADRTALSQSPADIAVLSTDRPSKRHTGKTPKREAGSAAPTRCVGFAALKREGCAATPTRCVGFAALKLCDRPSHPLRIAHRTPGSWTRRKPLRPFRPVRQHVTMSRGLLPPHPLHGEPTHRAITTRPSMAQRDCRGGFARDSPARRRLVTPVYRSGIGHGCCNSGYELPSVQTH